jgi:nucleotide-binding universal stress UspA family protein
MRPKHAAPEVAEAGRQDAHHHRRAHPERAEAERALAAIVAEHGIPPSRLVPIVREGLFPDAVILDQARDADVDLVVIGTHGRRAGGGRRLLGSTAVQVVHFAPCPVLVVPARPPELEMPMIERILVPVDFSDPAREALRHARELALTYGATLDLLHVFDPGRVDELYAAAGRTADLGGEDVRGHVERALERWALADESEVPARTHFASGRPATRIVETARALEAGLVVIASHGAGGVGEALLGTTAERVLRLSPIPVFVVRSDGKSLLPAP